MAHYTEDAKQYYCPSGGEGRHTGPTRETTHRQDPYRRPLPQRQARLPIAVFEQMMGTTLQPKGEPTRHPEAFYQGLRLCGVDGSLFSVTNTPQARSKCARRGAGGGGRRSRRLAAQ